jgi:PIN domain
MTKTLTVFPDTNLFLQCKPLRELDWRLIGHQGDVNVIITRPVQAELDALKAKGNTRQASRSRTASALLAELLDAPEDGLVLRQDPTVRLRMALDLRHDPAATDRLNYDSKDDQLVGIALAFHKANTEEPVALVTYDNGPLFSARSVQLPFKKIPEEWLLPPELDDGAKREAALKKELERLQNSEPKFEIRLEGATEKGYEFNYELFQPLSPEESETLLAEVFERYPEATEFGPKEPYEKTVNRHGPAIALHLYGEEKEVFTPATAEQIENYKKRYAEWKDACRGYLQDIHKDLNKRLTWPSLIPLIANNGSRPADDALIEIEAKGSFAIARPSDKCDEDQSDNEASGQSTFPRPPIAPKGHLQRVRPPSPFSLSAGLAAGQILSPSRDHLDRVLSSLHSTPTPKDPNAFYWQAGLKREFPVSKISLKCEQWRHARKEEAFTVGLRFRQELGIHAGSLIVSVHAANLSSPAKKTWPVKIVVEATSPLAEVKRQVEELSKPDTRFRLN